MTDEAAILAAILDRPLDDTPRLVFADYLDDHGDPDRAEFIRGQCELARMTGFRRADRLRKRQRSILAGAGGLRGGGKRDLSGWFIPGYLTWEYGAVCVGKLPGSASWNYRCEFARGFVDEIRVPSLADLLGCECGRCGGDGLSPMADHHRATPCRSCSGTGTTPGIAAAVFGEHPVTRVVVADREPWALDTTNVAWWRSGVQVENRASLPRLPREVYDKLRGGVAAFGGLRYYSRAAAIDALSAALVDYCRGLVGLAPIYAAGVTK